jgi:hypothetical protein
MDIAKKSEIEKRRECPICQIYVLADGDTECPLCGKLRSQLLEIFERCSPFVRGMHAFYTILDDFYNEITGEKNRYFYAAGILHTLSLKNKKGIYDDHDSTNCGKTARNVINARTRGKHA